MAEKLYGNEPGNFGFYEFVKSLNWMALLVAVLSGVVAWVAAELVPALSALGGYFAMAVPFIMLALNAIRQWLSDNTHKSL